MLRVGRLAQTPFAPPLLSRLRSRARSGVTRNERCSHAERTPKLSGALVIDARCSFHRAAQPNRNAILNLLARAVRLQLPVDVDASQARAELERCARSPRTITKPGVQRMRDESFTSGERERATGVARSGASARKRRASKAGVELDTAKLTGPDLHVPCARPKIRHGDWTSLGCGIDVGRSARSRGVQHGVVCDQRQAERHRWRGQQRWRG